MIIDAYYAQMIMLANGVLLAIACYALVRFERRCRQIEAFWASPTGSAVADDQADEQMLITQRLEKRVGELQRSVKVIELKRGETDEKPVVPVERSLPIENAVRMARRGAGIDDLTRSCGLNIGEARLMQKLHGKARPAAAGN